MQNEILLNSTVIKSMETNKENLFVDKRRKRAEKEKNRMRKGHKDLT